MNDIDWANDQDLKLADKHNNLQALMHLHSIADKSGVIQTTLGVLAKEWNWHKETVRRYLDKLKENGYCDGNVTDCVTLTYRFRVSKQPKRVTDVTVTEAVDYSKYTEDDLKLWDSAQEWFKVHCERVQQLPQPLTIDEYWKLRKDYNKKLLVDTLKAMHNYKPLLKNYVSAYRTVRKWMNKENGQ